MEPDTMETKINEELPFTMETITMTRPRVTKAMTHHVTVAPLTYPVSSAISHTSAVFYLMPAHCQTHPKRRGGGAAEPRARVSMV